MKYVFIIFNKVLFLLLTCNLVSAQKIVSKKDSLSIVNILFNQQQSWNNGDIDAFMEGYMKTNKLVFSGASGPIYGWKSTRNR